MLAASEGARRSARRDRASGRRMPFAARFDCRCCR